MKRLFYLVIALLLVHSCQKNPPEPTELYEKYRNSVVLIRSSNYFKATLENDWEFYYTVNDNGIVFHETEDEAYLNASAAFGTGFIIDNTGKIMTNRHVVAPDENKGLVLKEIENQIYSVELKIKQSIADKRGEKDNIADLYNSYYDALTYSQLVDLKNKYEANEDEIIELQSLLKKLEINLNNTIFEMKSAGLGVVYDNTFVETINDFEGCVLVDKSDIADVDLALIQLKSKRTPEHITNYFSLEKLDKDEEIKLNDDVYMIGYNHGISLANTSEGVKSQFTHGTITQEPDSQRLMYSTPTLPGSSGSPIIDEWGNLVAVNFAKTADFQGFSFGVPLEQVMNFYSDEDIPKQSQMLTASDEKKQEGSEYVDYSDHIRRLLLAEERRSFEDIYTYFSKNMKRYWSVDYPTRDELLDQYKKAWSRTSNAKNDIINIDRLNSYNYILKTDFTYFDNKYNVYKTVTSNVRFKFDESGKIVEVYGLDQ